MRRTAGSKLLACLIVCSACAVNPVTGRPEFLLMSGEREAALGRQLAQQVERDIGLVDDAELSAYVDAIGQRLARHSPRRDVAYRFAIADMPEPNAFALPGGYIYLTRGLLAITNSEAELANVMGHEIGHVAARHAAQRETRAAGVGLLAALGAIAAGAAGGTAAAETAAQLGQLAGAGLIASYGRDQERQADEIGQQLAAQGGWSPAAMASFLATLERESALRSVAPQMPSFFDSHPITVERVRTSAARAGELSVTPDPPLTATRAGFLAHLEGLLLGLDPAAGLFEGERFLHPDLGFTLEFPPAWQTRNGRSAVGAAAPRRDALIVLETQGGPEDPERAAARFAETRGLVLGEGVRLSIGGYDAYRAWSEARSSSGRAVLDLTFIRHREWTFCINGIASASRFDLYAPGFRSTARSFRDLTRSERGRITERRLRIARAREGESLASLSRRSRNAWTPDETAVANGLPREVELRRGELVKIAVDVPYTAREH